MINSHFLTDSQHFTCKMIIGMGWVLIEVDEAIGKALYNARREKVK